jgi:hypothetical protein
VLKSLYGLKQSHWQWNKRFDEFMKILGFAENIYDPCVYMKRVSNSIFGYMILVLYAGGILILAKNQSDVDELKARLSDEFRMKDLGKAKRIFGMDIKKDMKIGKLWLDQSKYTKRVFARFNTTNAKLVSVPLVAHFKLSNAQCPITDEYKRIMSKIPYDKTVGSLMYLMTSTRPDISLAIGKVSRSMSNPSYVH